MSYQGGTMQKYGGFKFGSRRHHSAELRAYKRRWELNLADNNAVLS